MTMARMLARLRRDRRGATIVEFALVAPVLLLVIMGLGDLLYQPYVQAVLDGALQKAGRDSALEDYLGRDRVLDERVEAMVRRVAPEARFRPERRSYASFALIKPETIYDKNGNGILDSKECFDDVNGNGRYDTDPGRTGQGGADDVTRYTMHVTYPRLFPLTGLAGMSPNVTIQSSTLLKNQPYKTQTSFTIPRICLP